MGRLKQLARILGLAVRGLVLWWASLFLLMGMVTVIDPAIGDSEPQEHSPLERLWGGGTIALSLSWTVSPLLARRGFRKQALFMLLALPLCFMLALLASMWAQTDYSLKRAFFGAFMVFTPAFLTIFEILANRNPIRVLELVGKWQKPGTAVVTLR